MVKVAQNSKKHKKTPEHKGKYTSNQKQIKPNFKQKEDKKFQPEKPQQINVLKIAQHPKKTILSIKQFEKKAPETPKGGELTLKKPNIEKSDTLKQSSNISLLKKATTKVVSKKEGLPPETYTSTEKHVKKPISLDAINYVKSFLKSFLSEEEIGFLYKLKLDYTYEDSQLKAECEQGLACKYLYILQSKGIAEYIKRERAEEKARFDFLWIIKSDEILRQTVLFYAKQLRESNDILDLMSAQEIYRNTITGKTYTFDEAVECNFVDEDGTELKAIDARELLKKKHNLEHIINSLTDVQLTTID